MSGLSQVTTGAELNFIGCHAMRPSHLTSMIYLTHVFRLVREGLVNRTEAVCLDETLDNYMIKMIITVIFTIT